MIHPRALFISIIALVCLRDAFGQAFINGDLEGPSPTSLSILPPGWLKVPSTDPVCLATDGSAGDTPDLTDTLGPSAFSGIVGNPYSGNTFMSGDRGDSESGTWNFQEGIMQTVSGFVPDSTYTIKFFQSVVKSNGSYDTSGAWAVYAGSTLLGITEPTASQVPYDEWPFIWEERTISFSAWSTSHTIKFLPVDDDSDVLPYGPNGSLRMGIDAISLLQGHHLVGIPLVGPAKVGAVFPNPFADHLTIAVPPGFTIGSVRVHASTGELVHEYAWVNGDQQVRIDLSVLRSGTYLVHVVLDTVAFHRVVFKE